MTANTELPLEYFYIQVITDLYQYYTSFIGILTFLLSPILFYAILTQSKSLGNLKWFILNHNFWLLMMELMFFLFKPILIFPYNGVLATGILRTVSYKTFIIGIFTTLLFTVFAGLGLAGTFIERYVGAFDSIFKKFWNSTYAKIAFALSHLFFLVMIVVYIAVFLGADRDVMKNEALNMSKLLEVFVDEPSFFAVNGESHKIGDLITIIFCLGIGAGAGVVVIIFSWHLFKNRQVKSLTTCLRVLYLFHFYLKYRILDQ
ncbi:hypothetical protein FO519_004572 [Halicephalobus sp. NKZ332]|nr:hypothetical protein FO519_004572 [Halicephalobus sp. NKZ332]